MFFVLLTFWPWFGNVPWAALPIGVMILGTLHMNVAVVEQKYMLTDQLGQETSYPLEGASVKIICTGKKATKNTYLTNLTLEEEEKKENVMKNTSFRLDNGLIGTKYKCYGADGSFQIGQLHCDPFSLIPKVMCKDKQWCLVSKDGQAMCKNKKYEQCFLGDNKKDKYKTSLPTFSVVCYNKTEDKEYSIYGLCDAVSENRLVVGFSSKKKYCSIMEPLIINNWILTQEKTLLLPVSGKKWKFQYNGDGEVSCAIMDANNKSYAITEPFETGTDIEPKFGDIHLPQKMKISCLITVLTLYKNSITGYAIVFDPDISKYDVSISKMLKAGHLELGCSCKVPEGFVCGWTWEKPKMSGPKMSDALQDMPVLPDPKTLLRKNHVKPIVYTCFLRVLAFDYPYSFKLKPVPLSVHKEANVTVDAKDFDEGGDGDGDDDGNSGAGTGKTGNGKVGKGKNKENKSKEDSTSNKSTTIAAVAVTLVLLLVTAAIVAFVVVVFLRKKRAREEEEKENLLEIQRQKSEKRRQPDMSFINSIKDSPNKVDSAFVALFYRARLGISNEKRENEFQLLAFYKALPDFAIITTFWDTFIAYVPAPDELTSIPTARYTNKLLKSTWLHKDHVTTPTSKAKTSQKPEVLHWSIITDIFMVPRYFACQAPCESEMPIFLRTIIDQGVTLVVCLLALHEVQDIPGVKTHRYYDYLSLDVGNSMKYGEYTLFCATIHPSPRFVSRIMHIKYGENVHKFFILRYLAWPDMGVGKVEHLLELCHSIKNLEAEKPGRTAVHCSAGLGRTGCLLAALQCLQLYDFQNLPFDISAVCLKVRKERHEAIQKFPQMAMVYWVVAAYDEERLQKLAPADKTIKQELTVRPKLPKVSESPVAKDKQRSSASTAPKVTPSKQKRASKSSK